jgi:3-carboxy-cis,cis-muconate cycloisomerase
MHDAPLLSPLFDCPAIRALFAAQATLAHFGAFEAALAHAQAEEGIISPAAATVIATAIATFIPDEMALHSGLQRDGLPIPAYVAQLRAHLPPEHAASFHKATTSQDVMDTALTMTLRMVNTILASRIDGILASLDTLDARFGAAPLMARTRMQAALPVTVTHRLDEWRMPLHAARRDLAALRPALECIQFGGPVGDRRGMGRKGDAVAARLAAALGLNDAPCWHTDRSRIVAYGAWLARLVAATGKVGLDLTLMAQQGIDAARLAGGGGSSAMPHKQNPVAAEALVTLSHEASMLAGGLQTAMLHEHERSGIAWALEWLTLPRLCAAAGAATSGCARLLESVESMGEA